MRKFLFIAVLPLALTVACKKEAAPASAMTDIADPVAPKTKAEAMEQVRDNFSRVHFDTDSAALDSQSKSMLAANAQIMRNHPDIRVEVQGHCDERGTTEYNLALGSRRAKAVTDYMVGAGVAKTRIDAKSYGEERPLAAGEGEIAWSQNRRAEFRVYDGGDQVAMGTVQ